ncbi:MAG: gamma-glutamyl-gamma-aminobutyrate hydrolase family protein [Rhodospirillales bacterium]
MANPSPFLPVIGLPACTRMGEHTPFHGVGAKYVTAVAEGAGALPVLLPALGEHYPAEASVAALDGILFTGSPSNVEPRFYGGPASAPGTLHDAARDATTLPLIRAAIRLGVPIFCICRGIQELNVALGGTLHQNLHEVPGLLDHRSRKDVPMDERYREAHPVSLPASGFVRALNAGAAEAAVNSLHAQGIDRLAPGLAVEATAPDGLIEAARVKDAPAFALGVQWHPEHALSLQWKLSRAMFAAFGRAAAERAAKRRAQGVSIAAQ